MVPRAWLESLIGQGIRPGLDRIRIFLEALDPARDQPLWVTVGGTNGKGSTAAIIDAILNGAGISTLLYTSPHLVRIEERWRIFGDDVAPERLDGAIERLRVIAGKVGFAPTYFEALTLIAFLLREETGARVGVLEVGMGGRLDAVNAVDAGIAVITSVALDHTKWLGSDLEAIAREKAGIIKSGSVVVSGVSGVAAPVVRRQCEEVGARLIELGNDLHVSRIGGSGELRISGAGWSLEVTPVLEGAHQIHNHALAVAAAREAGKRIGTDVEEAVGRGVRGTRWRGRLERFDLGDLEVIVDGAHNPAAAGSIAAALEQGQKEETAICFGALDDKDWKGMLSRLEELGAFWFVTEPDSERAESSETIVGWLRDRSKEAQEVSGVLAAIELARERKSGRLLVCGSLYLAGEAIETLDGLVDCGRPNRKEENK